MIFAVVKTTHAQCSGSTGSASGLVRIVPPAIASGKEHLWEFIRAQSGRCGDDRKCQSAIDRYIQRNALLR